MRLELTCLNYMRIALKFFVDNILNIRNHKFVMPSAPPPPPPSIYFLNWDTNGSFYKRPTGSLYTDSLTIEYIVYSPVQLHVRMHLAR